LQKYFKALTASRLPGIVRKRKRAFKPDAPEPEQIHRPLIERKPNASGQLTFDALAKDTPMKIPKTAHELEVIIREELLQHHELPPAFTIAVVRDGDSWRAICHVEPEKHWTKIDEGEVVARVAQIGDKFALE
jgi:hypothetical protein